jgi:hypothetical protein
MTRTDDAELFAPDDRQASDAAVAEVPLLLPAGQVAALEGEAHRLGMTAAQVLRGLVRDFLRQRRGE